VCVWVGLAVRAPPPPPPTHTHTHTLAHEHKRCLPKGEPQTAEDTVARIQQRERVHVGAKSSEQLCYTMAVREEERTIVV
jgi:hypothetical protein